MHVDLVGPLPPSQGYVYILTCVDRFTRWPQAIPLNRPTSEEVAQAFLSGWVSTFGCPATVTSDRGPHFDGAFDNLLKTLGCKHVRTTAYHPQANGLVERLHRQLKAALKAQDNPSWSETLPLVLLSLRNTFKKDIHATAAELVFGQTLRLPGELVSPTPPATFDYGDYAKRLAHHMRLLQPALSREQHRPSYLPPSLRTASHVFIKVGGVRPSMRPPYTGPFRVLSRADKFFIVDINGKRETISIDRLKPAVIDSSSSLSAFPTVPSTSLPQPPPTANPTSVPTSSSNNPTSGTAPIPVVDNSAPPTSVSRRGRTVRFPIRFADYA
ncbi:DDE-type integrase/transposase/recombinase [Streptococcus dysgalactiae subsp. equisimilis]|nr:DDE-type integrase/transposase/recombinase [Streptococcus dysgalactiae subsp. equisimilis]